jgi:hypothetical protein
MNLQLLRAVESGEAAQVEKLLLDNFDIDINKYHLHETLLFTAARH